MNGNDKRGAIPIRKDKSTSKSQRALSSAQVLADYRIAGIMLEPSGPARRDEADQILPFAKLGSVLLPFTIGLQLPPRRCHYLTCGTHGLNNGYFAVTTFGLDLLDLSWTGSVGQDHATQTNREF